MTILVSGSVAFDHIMVFPDRFKNHILPEKLHIAERLLQHHEPEDALRRRRRQHRLPPAPARRRPADPRDRRLRLRALRRVARPQPASAATRIRVFDDIRTPQGFVTTDLDDNQIWAFYEGAMARAHEARVEDVREPLTLAIVSSNGRQAMVEHARALKARGVPT